MSNGLMGMDVEGSRAMATDLASWPSRVGDVVALVSEAEMLADFPTGVPALLGQVGTDASAMAASIREAADALESFTIELSSPRAIAIAAADVWAFRGTENDPERDRRLGVLRRLIEAGSSSDVDAAHVMAAVLAANQPVHLGLRDLADVVAERENVMALAEAEQSGRISKNDPAIDQAVDALRDAIDRHTASDAQTDLVLAELLRNRDAHDTVTMVTSAISGYSVGVVRYAHDRGLDYDVADGTIKMARVDRLTAALDTAPLPEVADLHRQRHELLIELGETNDPIVLRRLTSRVDTGVPALEVFANFDVDAARWVQDHHVAEVARSFDLDMAEAEAQLAEMADATIELVEAGFDLEAAALAVDMAARAGIDINEIATLANSEDELGLVDAAVLLTEADVMAMTVDEYRAFQGFVEHFSAFDAAITGETDELVSLADLEHIVSTPDNRDPELVAAAAAMIASPALLNRLDRGRDHGDVVGEEPFGATKADDHKVSNVDVGMFVEKQVVNHTLHDLRSVIDVAAQGGDPALIDFKLSEADYEAVLAQADELGLSASEVAAVERVLEFDWYDKTLWQEHSDSIMLSIAVVAGAAIFVASGGTGGGVTAALIGTAAASVGGALTTSAVTITENLVTGDEWDEDLAKNQMLGGIGGLAGAGLAGAPAGASSPSLAVRTVTKLGFGADVAGLASAGAFDPLLTQVFDDIELEDFKETSGTASYALAGASLTVAGGSALTSRTLANGPSSVPEPNHANFGGDMFDDGVAGVGSTLELSPAAQARLADAAAEAAERAELLGLANELADGSKVQATQRVTGVGFDLAASDDGSDEQG